MTTKLGPFEFISLSPLPLGVRRQLDIEARAGVDGHALWDVGKRGEIFQALSVTDVATLVAGRALFRDYELAIGGPPLLLRWSDMTETAFKLEVLDVRLVQLKQLVIGVGGVAPDGNAMLRAEWTLLPVAI